MEKNAQNLHSRKNFTLYITFVLAFIMIFLLFIGKMSAQVYNKCAAQNAIYEESLDSRTGNVRKVKVESDRHGNAQGNQYDLAVDGAFQGETIVVLHLYIDLVFDLL